MLLDDTAASTSVTISWTADGAWRTPPEPDGTETPNEKLHKAGLDTSDDRSWGGAPKSNVVFSNVNSFFADSYNVIVYVGSDTDGRVSHIRLNGANDIWFESNTKFDEPGGHTRAAARSSLDAYPSNYVLYRDVTGESFKITLRNPTTPGTSIHGIQITDQVPGLGDMDFDSDVDFDDIDDFVLALQSATNYAEMYGVPPEVQGDIDGSGYHDFDDIEGFAAIFRGSVPSEMQPIPEPSAFALGFVAMLGILVTSHRITTPRASRDA